MNKSQKNENCNFGKGLKHFLERCSLNEKEIAKQCGVSLPLVYNWLNGKNIPTYKSLQKLYNLGMDQTEIFSFPESHIEKNESIDNHNQSTLADLAHDLLFSQRRYRIMLLKQQKSFNALSQNDKISFLGRSIGERIAELDELNEILKDVNAGKHDEEWATIYADSITKIPGV